MNKLKVFHTGQEIAGNMARICKYLNRHPDIDATHCNQVPTWLQYDTEINLVDYPDEEFVRHAINYFDLFHFHFGRSMARDLSDLDRIKRAGK